MADAILVSKVSSGTSSITTVGGTTSASGSTFVLIVNHDAGVSRTTALSALDNKGNLYVEAGSPQSQSGAKRSIYYCQNGAGGAGHQANITFDGTCYGTAYFIELTGVAAASFDLTGVAVTSPAPHLIPTGTLSQASEVILTVIGNGEGSNPMSYASSNSTILGQEGDGATYWSSAVSKLVVSSTASVSPSFTSNGGDNTHGLKFASFKAAASGSGVTGTGAITSSKATASGSGARGHATAGAAINAPKATSSGAGVHGITGTGALTITRVSVSSSPGASKTGTGAVTSSISTAAGTGVKGHNDVPGPIAIVAGTPAQVSGSGQLGLPRTASGAITSSRATAAGTASRGRTATGALTAAGSFTIGASFIGRTLTGSGAMAGPSMNVSATNSFGHSGTGAMTAVRPVVTGVTAGAGSSGATSKGSRMAAARRSARSAHGGR